MQLSAEQFAEIVKSLDRNSTAKAKDKRRAPRVEQRVSVSAVLFSEDAPPSASPLTHAVSTGKNPKASRKFLTVVVRNFSTRGLGILHSERIERNQQFVVHFSHGVGAPASILCTVVHCRAINEHLFAIGAEFTCVLSDPPSKSTPADRLRIQNSILD